MKQLIPQISLTHLTMAVVLSVVVLAQQQKGNSKLVHVHECVGTICPRFRKSFPFLVLCTLLTALPHNLIKEKLAELIEQTFNR